MSCCQQVIELTDKGKQLKTILQVLCAIEVIFFIARCFSGHMTSFTPIMLIILLVMAFTSCYYFFSGFTSFFILYELIYSFANVGRIIQNYFGDGPSKDKTSLSDFIVEVLYFAFSIVLLIYVFFAYREFKAIALTTGAQPQFMSGGMAQSRTANVYRREDYENQQSSSNNNNNQSKGGFKAFSGKGTVVGGN